MMLHGYASSLLEGAAWTLGVAACSWLIAMVLGMASAVASLAPQPVWRGVARGYTTLIRAVPDLVMMLLVYYGGQQLINHWLDATGATEPLDLNPFVAGVLTIGFIFGAYLSETLRGALLAVPAGQREAALSVGMTPRQIFVRVVGPQMLRHALAPLSNNWLVLLKSTAIVSVIGLTDLMHRAGLAAGATREPFLFYGVAAGLYLALTSLSEWAFAQWRRQLDSGVREAAL